jgi:hypothetical protein
MGNGTAYNLPGNRGDAKPSLLIKDPARNNNQAADLAIAPIQPNYIIDVNIIQPWECWPKERYRMIDLQNTSGRIISRSEIRQMPTSNINDMLALLPGIYQNRPGDELRIYGARREGTLYILDGMQSPWWQ